MRRQPGAALACLAALALAAQELGPAWRHGLHRRHRQRVQLGGYAADGVQQRPLLCLAAVGPAVLDVQQGQRDVTRSGQPSCSRLGLQLGRGQRRP
jgi:hypothetical protein